MKTMSDHLIRSALQETYQYQGDYIRSDCIHPIKGGVIVKDAGNQAEVLFVPAQKRVFFRWIEKRNNFKE